MTEKHYDVLIVGGGVSGTALFYELTHYTNLNQLGLIEKYNDFATVNSKGSNNSQTIHCGDIETNYSLDKALKVKKSADMLVNYAQKLPEKEKNSIIFKYPKMILGVGAKECKIIKARYDKFKEHYPSMQLLNKEQIAEKEPKVVLKDDGTYRNEELAAIIIDGEYTAIDYKKLSTSFMNHSLNHKKKNTKAFMNTQVRSITKEKDLFKLVTTQGILHAKFVVVCAGGHSLLLAHKMGYGKNFSCLPMAGSFYYTPEFLQGKVYTVQSDHLPFAAIHGDPDILAKGKTRFGPTALMLPMLERYNGKTIFEFFKVLKLDHAVIKVFWNLLKVKEIRRYIFKNFLFEIPFIRRRLFLHDAIKIIPSLKLKDISFATGIGGIRPQIIDKKNKELLMGEASISHGDGIIFNMTPSPGATSCLSNAERDMKEIINFLKCDFDEDKFMLELHNKTSTDSKDVDLDQASNKCALA